jgi:hypothetical protein
MNKLISFLDIIENLCIKFENILNFIIENVKLVEINIISTLIQKSTRSGILRNLYKACDFRITPLTFFRICGMIV